MRQLLDFNPELRHNKTMKPKIYYKLANPPVNLDVKYLKIAKGYLHRAMKTPNVPITISRSTPEETVIVMKKLREYITRHRLSSCILVEALFYVIYQD